MSTKKNEINAEEIRAELVKEFDTVSVDAMLPLLGTAFPDVAALSAVLTKMKERDAAEKVRREKEKKDTEDARNKARMEAQEALSKVFKSIGVKDVPKFLNDVRDEKRYSQKVTVKGGEKEKVHDRQLVGLRFTSGLFNFCFQVEVPRERTTGATKFSMTDDEWEKAIDTELGKLAKVVLASFDKDGAFIL